MPKTMTTLYSRMLHCATYSDVVHPVHEYCLDHPGGKVEPESEAVGPRESPAPPSLQLGPGGSDQEGGRPQDSDLKDG